MPTITFSKKDFEKLVGKKFTKKELEYFLSFAKGELDDLKGDEVTAGLDDTNQPSLWSVEGLARLARGIFGIEKGIPDIKINKSNYSIIIHKDTEKVRPFISCFVAKGKKLSDDFLKQMIQLQEKLADSFGRKRKKLSIGLYPVKKINFPIHYRLEDADKKFIPLEYSRELSLKQILKEHPKGKEYASILDGLKKYPVLIDDKDNILSMAPIINSKTTGKLDVGEDEIFFDCTGTDESAVMLSANIFAQALFDRGFKIFSCEMIYPDKKIISPDVISFSLNLDPVFAENLIGEKLSLQKIKDCLKRMRCDFKDNKAIFPCYRGDVMHMVDAVEDVVIGYGYDKLTPLPFTSYTKGSILPKEKITRNVRNLIIGLEFQEIFSTLLSNKELLYSKMNAKDLGTIEIDSYLSETYSVVRTWLLPGLLDLLSHNNIKIILRKFLNKVLLP